jgi:hypothetical protein
MPTSMRAWRRGRRGPEADTYARELNAPELSMRAGAALRRPERERALAAT